MQRWSLDEKETRKIEVSNCIFLELHKYLEPEIFGVRFQDHTFYR